MRYHLDLFESQTTLSEDSLHLNKFQFVTQFEGVRFLMLGEGMNHEVKKILSEGDLIYIAPTQLVRSVMPSTP
jgi:hypothetical protein